MTVAELLGRLSSAEFSEWMAYFELEPFGPLRDDARAGTVATVLAEINRDRKKRASAYKVSDFFPETDPDFGAHLLDEPEEPEQGEKRAPAPAQVAMESIAVMGGIIDNRKSRGAGLRKKKAEE